MHYVAFSYDKRGGNLVDENLYMPKAQEKTRVKWSNKKRGHAVSIDNDGRTLAK
jgi:hypothetical protein